MVLQALHGQETRLCDLDFADNISLLDESWHSMQQTTLILEVEANKVGLYLNPGKCKVLTTNAWNDRSDIQAAG